MAKSAKMVVPFGNVEVQISADSLVELMSFHTQIQNLNRAATQEGLDLEEVEPFFRENDYTYFGFRHIESGAEVNFGVSREGSRDEDPDKKYFSWASYAEGYKGFRERPTSQNEETEEYA